MRPIYNEIWARAARYADGYKAAYTAEETAHRLQAGQWINWPLFLSQPIIPVVASLFPFALFLIVIAMLAINILWMRVVSQHFVSLPLSKFGNCFARLKWLSCPLMALLLCFKGHVYVAVLALAWPILLLPLLFALHPLFPANGLANTQKQFRLAERATVND